MTTTGQVTCKPLPELVAELQRLQTLLFTPVNPLDDPPLPAEVAPVVQVLPLHHMSFVKYVLLLLPHMPTCMLCLLTLAGHDCDHAV